MIKEYYKECRNGDILEWREGFVAYSRIRASIFNIEHIWVHPTFRSEAYEPEFIKKALEKAKEIGCRYATFEVSLGQPKVFAQHRLLVELGFYPLASGKEKLIYERRV